MKEIEGINLAELVRQEDEEIVREKQLAISKQIRGIILNIHQWTANSLDLEKQLKKNQERIEGAKTKLLKIQGGDWSVLEDDKPQQQGREPSEALK